MKFKEKLTASRDRNNSNIILALDVLAPTPRQQLAKAKSILKSTAPHICALKINRQLILSCGLDAVSRHILRMSRQLRLPTIMDAKINDVGHTNAYIASAYYQAGFDAVIASPFVGWEDGLEPVFRLARQKQRGVILLVYMSHRAASEGYGRVVVDHGRRLRMFESFAIRAKLWKADGAIVGATRPRIIRQVKEILGEHVPVLAPGLGAQGGDVVKAIRSGADYLIIGRTIVNARNPRGIAEQIVQETRRLTYKNERSP